MLHDDFHGCQILFYQVRLLLNAAKITTMVATSRAECLAHAHNDGCCPLSMVQPDRLAINDKLMKLRHCAHERESSIFILKKMRKKNSFSFVQSGYASFIVPGR